MFKTSLAYFLIRATNGLLALAMIFSLTRLLSAEQYGIYALGMAGVGLFGSVFFQWIAVAVARFHAAHASNSDSLLNEAYRLFFRVVAVVSAITILCATWPPIKSITPELVLAIGLGSIAMGLHSLGLQVANARGQPARFGRLTASRGVLALLAATSLAYAGFGGVGAVFGIAFASMISAITFGARRLNKKSTRAPEIRHQIIVYGLPLTMTYFATIVLDVSDRFLIGWWLGPSAVGGYAAAYDLPQQVIGAIMNVLFLAAYPRITAAWEAKGTEGAREAMLPLSRAMLLGAPLIAGLFIGCASEISRIVFGEQLRSNAAEIMPWIALGITIGCFKSFFFDIAFQLEKVLHIQLRITVAIAVLNVVLNFVLIPKFGVVGSAMATTVAFSIGAVLSWWFGRRLGIYPSNLRDVLGMFAVLAAVVISVRIVPVGNWGGAIEGVVRFFVGIAGYIVVAVIVDLAGMRSALVKNIQDKVNLNAPSRGGRN